MVGYTWPCLLAPALFSSPAKADRGKEPLTFESGEDEEDEEEEEDDDDKRGLTVTLSNTVQSSVYELSHFLCTHVTLYMSIFYR